MDYDVVVVGSGAGALVGAWAAARLGLRTVVLEKADRLGGTSAYSGGGMFLPGNSADRWGLDLPRDPLWGGQSLIAQLVTVLRASGVTILTGHCVDELVVEDARVVGVRAGGVEVRATRGVLLAAGGFERNAEL